MNRISIGILAHNESAVICDTLQSLFAQTLLTDVPPRRTIEVIVVPNGCSDDTAAVARAALEELAKDRPGVTWAVHDLARPGKADAWNDYVHQFADPAADLVYLLDADIRFIQPQTLANMLTTLAAEPDARAVTDAQVKDVALLPRKSLAQRLSLVASRQRPIRKHPHGLCGQCYAVRGDVIRQIWMPAKLPAVEDGFLYASITSDRFTGNGSHTWVVGAPNASHVYEAYSDLPRVIRHEAWIMAGSTLLVFLYTELWAAAKDGTDSGTYIARRNAEDPDWFKNLCEREIAKRGHWVVPKGNLKRRFWRLREFPVSQRIVRFPIALVMQAADWVVCWQANAALRNGRAMGYWGKKQAGPKVAPS